MLTRILNVLYKEKTEEKKTFRYNFELDVKRRFKRISDILNFLYTEKSNLF